MPVLVFCHSDPSAIPFGKSEIDEKLRERLQVFRNKAMTGRVVKFWMTSESLTREASIAVYKAIETHGAIGWLRETKLIAKGPKKIGIA